MQILGTIVLGTGIWLAVDKASLIALLKMVESEHIKVSKYTYVCMYVHVKNKINCTYVCIINIICIFSLFFFTNLFEMSFICRVDENT